MRDSMQGNPFYWERREARSGNDFKMNPVKWQRADFWDLFSVEIGHWITSQPVEDVIPLLRCLIDKYWDLEESRHPHVCEIVDNVHCLLYYAWDRAREVRDLRCRVHEMEARLFAFTAGQS
jgi:hypothetical protein